MTLDGLPFGVTGSSVQLCGGDVGVAVGIMFANGARSAEADISVPEPLVSLAFVAAVAPRIRLGTGVLILPRQHPLVVAKQAATLDRLCGGRLMLGVGAGWLREE